MITISSYVEARKAIKLSLVAPLMYLNKILWGTKTHQGHCAVFIAHMVYECHQLCAFDLHTTRTKERDVTLCLLENLIEFREALSM